ncbi:MAG TPA: hypothetical protein VIY48_19145 [Candidatus Paceibacterota bacterium]
MATTLYTVTVNSLWPGGSELETTWEVYQDAITDAVRKATASKTDTPYYVHEVTSRPVYKVQRDVKLIAEVIDEGSTQPI